jgi:hypothetical protein
MSVSIDRFVSGTFDLDLWIKLLQLRYDSTTQSCDQFIVGGINIFDSINSKRDTDSSYSRAEVDTAVATINTKALANTASIATISTKATTNTASISTINSTITTISTNLNTAISGVDNLNDTCYLKSISGVNNRLNLDSRFRIYTNTTDTFSIQRLDNDGTIVTGAWLDLMKITFDTNTNETTSVIINGEDILAKMNSTVDQSYVDDELATKANTSDLSLLYQAKLKMKAPLGIRCWVQMIQLCIVSKHRVVSISCPLTQWWITFIATTEYRLELMNSIQHKLKPIRTMR